MGELINLNNTSENTLQKSLDFDLIEISEDILFDTKADISDKKSVSMPITQLAALGAGVASLLPTFRTVTQAMDINASGLYRIINGGVNPALKTDKFGNNWGIFKTSKFAKFQKVGPISANTTSVMPIDPMTIMMAVALFSIEQKLDSIAETGRQILSFLEIEKESEIEADMETLISTLTKYKHGWDNEHFIASNHKLVLDIQRTARKHMTSYQKKVTDVLSDKKLVVLQSKVNETLNDLIKKFKYYRLSLYTFSMASFVEIMLSGDFKEENILCIRDELEKTAAVYRDLYEQCSVYLEKLTDSSIETNLLKGIGTASKAVGRFVEKIPVIKEGQVDEFLQDSGAKMKDNASRTERKVIESFAQISNPGIGVFVEKMNDLIQIYGHTQEIYFDDKNIYLVAG